MGRLSALGIPRTGARGALNLLTAAAAIGIGLEWSTHAVERVPAQHGALVVKVRTSAPHRPALRVTTDSTICGTSVADESIVGDNGALANVVVRLPKEAGAHPPSVEIVNEKCAFVPHVALAARSATIRMVSRDHALHTVHATLDRKSLFNVGLPVPNVTLTRPARGAGPIALTCNTHPWMSGYVYLTDERAALTNRAGLARFDGLRPGPAGIEIWHETLGTRTATATIVAGAEASLEISVDGK